MVFEKALEDDKPCAIIANLVGNFMNLHQNVIVEPILVNHVHELLVNIEHGTCGSCAAGNFS